MNTIKKALTRDSSSEAELRRDDHRDSKHTRHASIDSDRASIPSRRDSLGSPRSASSGKFEGGNEGHRLPVQRGVKGRAEETGPATSVRGRASGDFADPHSLGHDRSHSIASAFDPKSATHSHTHLAEKIRETRHHHEIEEVERHKEHVRHVTHVQHHVQPIRDEEHVPEVITKREIPHTHIEERHISSEDDHKAFMSLHTHRDSVKHAPKERTVVDLGERVNETVIHHVHNVVQPIIVKDTHSYTRVHTKIPVRHVTKEAPIIHQSIEHPIMDLKEFMAQKGSLGSKHTHDNIIDHVLFTGECSRKVDGVAEDMARDLNLKQGTMSHQHATDTRI